MEEPATWRWIWLGAAALFTVAGGIFVRGKRVRRHRLVEGDIVKLGLHELAFFRSDPKAGATVILDPDPYEADEDAGTEDERDA